ncbi:MAG: GNAT family N-acetyltransferase [Streptococcus sp.]|nr:GNAT family N-acetyltransferase [Streptococcus sp.]
MIEHPVVIREMFADEGETLRKKAKEALTPLEGLSVRKPNEAVVATIDNEIVGAFFLKVFTGKNNLKIGYLEQAFISKAHRGRGVGSKMYKEAIEKLKAENCEVISAIVTDDNVASWGLLKRHGFSKISFWQMIKLFGFFHSLLLCFRTSFGFAVGMNFWLSRSIKDEKSISEILSFLLGNTLFFTSFLLLRNVIMNDFQTQRIYAAFLALVVLMMSGFIGCLFSKDGWKFQLTRGGLFISGILMLFGIFFPLLGRWYPIDYKNTLSKKEKLGKQAAIAWGIQLVVFAICSQWLQELMVISILNNILTVFLFFHILAFYPLGYFGGQRVLEWNKYVYGILVLLTLFFIGY